MEMPKKLIDYVVDESTQEGNLIKYFCYDLNTSPKDKVLIYKEKRLVIVSKCYIEEYGCNFINAGNYADISDDYVLKSQQLVARASKYRDFLGCDLETHPLPLYHRRQVSPTGSVICTSTRNPHLSLASY